MHLYVVWLRHELHRLRKDGQMPSNRGCRPQLQMGRTPDSRCPHGPSRMQHAALQVRSQAGP
eukprot:10314714-Alexandrium_andersonii.AAC.1